MSGQPEQSVESSVIFWVYIVVLPQLSVAVQLIVAVVPVTDNIPGADPSAGQLSVKIRLIGVGILSGQATVMSTGGLINVGGMLSLVLITRS